MSTPKVNEEEEEEEQPTCRFCFEPAKPDEDDPLLSPCACRGGQAFIHASCLLRWRRMVVVNAPTHPAYWNEDTRHNVCNVCASEFTTEAPSRLTLMRSFTGAELAAMLDCGFLLVSHEAFSERLREKLRDLTPGLRRVCGYEHWIDGCYLITDVRPNSDDDEDEEGGGGASASGDAGEDIITAVNLHGQNELEEVVRGESRLFELVDGSTEDGVDGVGEGRRVRARVVIGRDGTVTTTRLSDGDSLEDEDESDQELAASRGSGSEQGRNDGAEGGNAEETDDEEETSEDSDDEENDDDDDEDENENENENEEEEGAREGEEPRGDRGGRAFMGHLRQLLSPFGPIYEVYQRYRRRHIVAQAFTAASENLGVPIEQVKDAVTLESMIGGPCDDDDVSLCIVPGCDDERGYSVIQEDLASAIALAYKRFADAFKDGDLMSGAVVKVAASGTNIPEFIGVAISYDIASAQWKVAVPTGLVEVKREGISEIIQKGGARVLMFWGTAKWSRTQLLGEIARGHWGLGKSEPRDCAQAADAYKRVLDAGLVFAPLTEMTEAFMRESIGEMNRIRSTGQLERAASPAPPR